MPDTETKPFGGFGFAIRTFWINGTDLSVSRRWERRRLMDPEAGDRFSTSIAGKALSEKDSVCVIGKDGDVKEFDLTIRSDEAAKQEWEWHQANDIYEYDGSTPELRVKARINEILSETPPTATLFVTDDDWEIGSKGGWSIECAVPPSVLARLEAELLAQRVHEIYMGIEWAAGLVRDEHAPPSFPTAWGLFSVPEGYGPEPLRGHVKFIGWRVIDKPGRLLPRLSSDAAEKIFNKCLSEHHRFSECEGQLAGLVEDFRAKAVAAGVQLDDPRRFTLRTNSDFGNRR